jgi:hypothetical protein
MGKSEIDIGIRLGFADRNSGGKISFSRFDTNLRSKHDRWKRGAGVEPLAESEAHTPSSVTLIP